MENGKRGHGSESGRGMRSEENHEVAVQKVETDAKQLLGATGFFRVNARVLGFNNLASLCVWASFQSVVLVELYAV